VIQLTRINHNREAKRALVYESNIHLQHSYQNNQRDIEHQGCNHPQPTKTETAPSRRKVDANKPVLLAPYTASFKPPYRHVCHVNQFDTSPPVHLNRIENCRAQRANSIWYKTASTCWPSNSNSKWQTDRLKEEHHWLLRHKQKVFTSHVFMILSKHTNIMTPFTQVCV